MAKCQKCGRGPQFGNNRPWSRKATRRRWEVNVQKVSVTENGRSVTQRLCTSCIRTISKTA
ncbi:MAG: 50S ribosomal protein L28 [Caldilineaceae bacterium]|nr:50S ribosomal protein L28 [Caldilineaceae bacterium]